MPNRIPFAARWEDFLARMIVALLTIATLTITFAGVISAYASELATATPNAVAAVATFAFAMIKSAVASTTTKSYVGTE